MFFDRTDAGRKLGDALKAYKGKKVIVLAIPRGGVPVGLEVAKKLNARFFLLVIRKLPFPSNKESGFGALSEDGTIYLQEDAKDWVTRKEINQIVKEQKLEIIKRQALRKETLPELKGKTVILIDDGIAMGSTMIAGINTCRKLGAIKVIVASPVAGKETAEKIARYADELIILETPDEFYAVAQAYYEWTDLTDEDVQLMLKKVNKRKN